MKKSDLPYYVNAGLTKAKGVASSVLASGVTVPQKIRGMVADNARGAALYDKGFGQYYENNFSIAQKGRTNGQKLRKAK